MISADWARNSFNEAISTLKETSYDQANGCYMTDSELMVYNFDKIKDSYLCKLENRPSSKPCSVDALYIGNGKCPVFIEFKNGIINQKIKRQLLEKAYCSVLILNDITGSSLSDNRNELDLIVVYNEEKINENDAECCAEEYVQHSNSRTEIAKFLAKKSNKEFRQFGLEKLENFCFKAVYTYSKKEFHNYFVDSHTF